MDSQLFLRDHFYQDRYYLLDTRTGAHTTLRTPPDHSTLGFASRMRVGLWGSEQLLVSLYTVDGSSLLLQIGNEICDVSSSGIQVERRWIGPSLYEFTLREQGVLRTAVFYWAFLQTGRESWPTYNDFLAYVCEAVRTRQSAVRLAYSWKALAEGQDLRGKAFSQELEARLSKIPGGSVP